MTSVLVTSAILTLLLAACGLLLFLLLKARRQIGILEEKNATVGEVLDDVQKAYDSRHVATDLERVRRKYARD